MYMCVSVSYDMEVGSTLGNKYAPLYIAFIVYIHMCNGKLFYFFVANYVDSSFFFTNKADRRCLYKVAYAQVNK